MSFNLSISERLAARFILSIVSDFSNCCNASFSAHACFASFEISFPIPEKLSFISFAAPEKSPEKNLAIAPPNFAIRSIITSIIAPKEDITLERNSVPFCVLANHATNEPNKTTIAPIPVEISASFNTFKAADNKLLVIAAVF